MKSKFAKLSTLTWCITLAISGQAAANTLQVGQLKQSVPICPTDISALTLAQYEALPDICRDPYVQPSKLKEWAEAYAPALSLTAVAAVVAGLAAIQNNSGNQRGKGSYTAPSSRSPESIPFSGVVSVTSYASGTHINGASGSLSAYNLDYGKNKSGGSTAHLAATLKGTQKQVSGVQAQALNREARIIGQRFVMLADSAPVVSGRGLAFNVVVRGDRRAEMKNKVRYDMVALARKFDTGAGKITASYGIARLTGNGGKDKTLTGNNGLTGGYSQFFGLAHSLSFGESNVWENSVRLDLHQLDSSRNIRFADVNRTAKSSGKQQQLEFRSEVMRTLELVDGMSLKPFIGVKLRHNIFGGYSETGAGEFNLSQNGYRETAVDMVSGLRMIYADRNGWGMQAMLEAGPNLSYRQSARKATLEGLQGQLLPVNNTRKTGGVNSKATLGVNYQNEKVALGMNAYKWREEGAADKGLVLDVSHSF